MKINFLKGTSTGRVLIVLYLIVCIVEGYNVFPIRELTTESIQRYNSISESAVEKLELIAQIRLNLDKIQSAKFRHILKENMEEMKQEILEINRSSYSNDSLYSELEKRMTSPEEEMYFDDVLEKRRESMESRKQLLRISMSGDKEKALDYLENTNEKARLDYSNALTKLTDNIVLQTKNRTTETNKYIMRKRRPVDAVLLLSVILVVITGIVVFIVNRKLNLQNAELIAQEKKYHDMVDNTEEMMATHNLNGEIIWANHSWKKNTQYSDEDIRKGIRAVDILDDETKAIYTERFQKIINGENVENAEGTIITKSGEKIFVYGKSVPVILKGKINGLQSFLRNITARKIAEQQSIIAEEKLIETSMRLQNVLNIFDNSFWGYDVQNKKMLYVSQGNEKVFGYPEKDFLSNGDLWFQTVLDEDKPKFKEVWEKLYRGQSVQIEFRIKLPDNSIKWVESKMAPSIVSGQLTRIDGLAIDINERKNSAAVIERNLMELKKTNDELDRFVYSTSHDLRAPLLAVQGLLDLMEHHGDDKAELSEYYRTVRKVVSQMDDTIKEILDYSRNSRLNIIPEQLDVSKIIDNARSQINQTYGIRKIAFEYTGENSVPFYSDKMRFTTIVNNLLVNAFKYTREEEPKPFVKVTFRSDEKYGVLIVEDNGEGIAQEYREKIFDMFYRVSEKSDSSGLGLYICREITDKLKGTIGVSSVSGKGSIFTVRIPNMNNTI